MNTRIAKPARGKDFLTTADPAILQNEELEVRIDREGDMSVKFTGLPVCLKMNVLPMTYKFEHRFPYISIAQTKENPPAGISLIKSGENCCALVRSSPQVDQEAEMRIAGSTLMLKFSLQVKETWLSSNTNCFSVSDPDSPASAKVFLLGLSMGGTKILPLADCQTGDTGTGIMGLNLSGGTIGFSADLDDRCFLRYGRVDRGWNGYFDLAYQYEPGHYQIGQLRSELFSGLESFLEKIGKQGIAHRKITTSPVQGWNSWDYYHNSVSEEKIIQNMEAINEESALSSQINTIVVDLGWEVRFGEWEADLNFPMGMEKLAEKIKQMGFRPGLWFAPIIIDPQCNQLHEDYRFVAQNQHGYPDLAFDCCGTVGYILDVTSRKGEDFLYSLFKRYREMGYTYFKLDFLRHLVFANQFSRKDLSSLEIMRTAIRIIREAVGEDSFILGCNFPFWVGPGLVDAVRVSGDIAVFWDSVKTNVKNISLTYFFNETWWQNDPDFFVIRGKDTFAEEQDIYRTSWFPRKDLFAPAHKERFDKRHSRKGSLSYDEARTYASFLLLYGGALVTGDPIGHLNEKGKELYQKVLSAERAPGKPEGLVAGYGLPPVMWQTLQDVTRVGFFNWNDEPQAMHAERLVGKALTDFWTGKPCELSDGRINLPPRTSMVLEFMSR